MSDDFKSFLKSMPVYNVPPILEDIIDYMLKMLAGIQIDTSGSIDNINMMSVARRMFELIPTEKLEEWGSAVGDGNNIRQTYKDYLAFLYLEVQHENTIEIRRKYEIAKWIGNMLTDFSFMTESDIIPNQDKFLERIEKDKQSLKNEMETDGAYTTMSVPVNNVNSITGQPEGKQKSPTLDFEINQIWKHGKNKLSKLSTMLFEDGFIAGKNDFADWLNVNSNNKCNWLKSRTTLIYLLWLLFDQGKETVSRSTLDIVCSDFLIKGKKNSMKIAQTTSHSIQTYFDLNATRLTADYSKVYRIYQICISFQ